MLVVGWGQRGEGVGGWAGEVGWGEEGGSFLGGSGEREAQMQRSPVESNHRNRRVK